MNHTTYLRAVADFHKAFQYRQPEPVLPDLGCLKTNELRPRLIVEEVREFSDAYEAGNRVDQLDALCDTQYVLTGSVLAWGYRALWEHHKHVVSLASIRDMKGHVAAMVGLVGQMEVAARLGFANQVLTFLILVQQRVAQCVLHCGFGGVFDEAFQAVHENNMGKLWSEDESDIETKEGMELLGVERFVETVGGKFIAYRHDRKIVKPPSHTKVDLGRFVK